MWQRDLSVNGWAEVVGITDESQLLNLAYSLGQPVFASDGSILKYITPLSTACAPILTLSARYGFGAFPLHTDTAYWPLPARYVLFMAMGTPSACTLVSPARDIFDSLSLPVRKAAEHSVSIVRTPHRSFYASIFFKENDSRGIRFDPCCVFPANSNADVFVKHFSVALLGVTPVKIKWTGANALIIDNWKALHGREAVSSYDVNRVLTRVYVR
jgi:alpha-ketoglutarate-dependent taurine dioxygenase